MFVALWGRDERLWIRNTSGDVEITENECIYYIYIILLQNIDNLIVLYIYILMNQNKLNVSDAPSEC